MGNCEYVSDYYNVPACIGRVIEFDGRTGVITKDRGNYIGVTFDNEEPGEISNLHPTYKVKYLEMGTVRVKKLTRSKQRYQDFLGSVYYESGESFAFYLGIDKE